MNGTTTHCPRCGSERIPFREGDGNVLYFRCDSYGLPNSTYYPGGKLRQSDRRAVLEELREEREKSEELRDKLHTLRKQVGDQQEEIKYLNGRLAHILGELPYP